MEETLLDVKHLQISFTRYLTTFEKSALETVKDISLQIKKGEIVAIVGASGTGKSLLAHGILGLLPENAEVKGEMNFLGEPLTKEKKAQYRGKEITFIPQSTSYLDPILKIKKQLSLEKQEKKTLVELLASLELGEDVLELYPYQLSGGMLRRVLFATALLSNPLLIVADEPTPGMDLKQSIKALGILKEKVEKNGTSVMLITHDLDLAMNMADELVFFNEGKSVAQMPPNDFEKGPKKNWPLYVTQMWQALPQNGFKVQEGKEC